MSTLTSNGYWPHNYDVVNETLDLELLKELSAQGAGFALLIDDADELPLKDLEAVCIALHEAIQTVFVSLRHSAGYLPCLPNLRKPNPMRNVFSTFFRSLLTLHHIMNNNRLVATRANANVGNAAA